MKILIVEPFFSGSHKKWACGFQQTSQHDVDILSLPGRHWKWRMYGAAVSLANAFKKRETKPDLIIASDMLDLTTFIALVRQEIQGIPIALYFHENQITYPWSAADQDVPLQRNNQYGFLNYTSALVADIVFYNSSYHLESFLGSLPDFLNQFPDHLELQNIELIRNKSEVLSLGIDLKVFDLFKNNNENEVPILLWNHRWEYDKNPEDFYEALCYLKSENLPFKLIMLGENYQKSPVVFKKIEKEFQKELLHFGYAKGFDTYANLLCQADILPVTNNQDFFGGSVVEAIYCGCFPLLPDRLAYPEHIPDDYKSHCFYHNKEEFHQKLKQALLDLKKNKVNQSLVDFVAPYDWSILAKLYDERFEKIRNEYHNL